MESKFLFFYGGIFSNWYSNNFVWKGITFNCSEQAMMWAKAMHFYDMEIAKKILEAKHPSDQKALGRKVRGFSVIEWEEVCFELVVDILVSKFTQSQYLEDGILATDELILVEASPTDTIWGIGLSETDPLRLDPKNWRGRNLLGKALMEARSIIKERKNHGKA